jgi:hypothetical protein
VSVQVNYQPLNGLTASSGFVFDTFATLELGEKDSTGGGVSLFFFRLKDIEKLVEALQNLGNRFANQLAGENDIPPDDIPAQPGVPPWPVQPGADTTGWTLSQKLGEQPPPLLTPEAETDELPLIAPKCHTEDCDGTPVGKSMYCAECLKELEKEIAF